VHFTQSSTSNTAASFTGDSLSQMTEPEHWLWDNPTPTPGTGNGTLNSGWIEHLRAMTAFVSDEDQRIPRTPRLMQNYPNPFNPRTNIGLMITDYGLVTLRVFDLRGREVSTLVEEKLAPGSYTAEWDAQGLAGGVYISRLETGGRSFTRKMLLLK